MSVWRLRATMLYMGRRFRWLPAFFRRAEPGRAAAAARALRFDAAVAVTAAAAAVWEAVWGLPVPPISALAAVAMTALPLALRRYYPISVWLVITAAIVSAHPAHVSAVATCSAVYAAYNAIARSRYRNRAIAAVVMVTVAVIVTLNVEGPHSGVGKVNTAFVVVPAAVAGLGISGLRRRLADSAANLRRAAAEARAATQAALAAERSRIAAELHDVVTHNVSVMIVQAGAARKILSSSPADAEEALLAVEATGREAMTELRNLLGLLSPRADGPDDAVHARSAAGSGVAVAAVAASAGSADADHVAAADDPAALTPQPGLGELDTLIGRVAPVGLLVELRVHGEPWPVPPGADLAAYRVVQEGLTNVLRHVGQAAVAVTIDWGEDLVITVTDDGGLEGRALAKGAPGRGLLGLRERLALYGGTLAAGPRSDGGWQLRAVMPASERSTA
jgi:signal transduction histidine kinase